MSIRQLKNKIAKATAQPKKKEIPGILGDLNDTVKVDDYQNVYVTLYNGQVVTARNTKVPNLYKLPVVLANLNGDPSQFEVVRMRNVFHNMPYLEIPDHATITHKRWGIDPVYVETGQIYNGLAIPSDDYIVTFYGTTYYLDGGWHYVGTQDIDFTSDIPATAGARYILVEVDAAGTVTKRNGTLKASKVLLTYADIPDMLVGQFPLFVVMVYYGQTKIYNTAARQDIFDIRFTGFSSGGIATILDWDDLTNIPPYLQDNYEHTHTSWRWKATGATSYDFPDFAYTLTAAYDNFLRVDPQEVGLSDDGSQLVFATAPATGHILTADYILRKM